MFLRASVSDYKLLPLFFDKILFRDIFTPGHDDLPVFLSGEQVDEHSTLQKSKIVTSTLRGV